MRREALTIPIFGYMIVAMATNQEPTQALQDLGFTGIEALVYLYLLRNAPATGYRVSHAIGKPTANTYKAIASLAGQGAVIVDDGGSGAVRAVPPDELLAGIARRAGERRDAARAALADLASDTADDRVYALRDREQVLERARAMLTRAGVIVLGDLFPATFDLLHDDLAAAAGRGVRVVVRTYAPAEAAGVRCVTSPGRDGAGHWPGQQLSLVVDGAEHLLALFDAGLHTVHQAVWSRSAFLSCLHHNHVAMELLVAAHDSARADSPAGADRALDDLADITVLTSQPPGLRRLREQVAGGAGLITSPGG
jgi:HTH-type transcriptional regulator, sugar sensing transcriptional regulator